MSRSSDDRLHQIMKELGDPNSLQDESLNYLKERAATHPSDELACVLFAYATQWHTLLPDDIALSRRVVRPLLESPAWACVAATMLAGLENWEPTTAFDPEAMHIIATQAEPTWTTPFVLYAFFLIDAGRMAEADAAFAQARSNLLPHADFGLLSDDEAAFEELFTGRMGRVWDPRDDKVRDGWLKRIFDGLGKPVTRRES
ncbi:MAG: hypothetical protein ACOH1T_02120 [Microbacteriaceae bacterium]